MTAATVRAIELEMQRQALITLLVLAVVFAITMYVLYVVIRAAIRDGIRDSGLVQTRRVKTGMPTLDGPDTLPPDMRAER